MGCDLGRCWRTTGSIPCYPAVHARRCAAHTCSAAQHTSIGGALCIALCLTLQACLQLLLSFKRTLVYK